MTSTVCVAQLRKPNLNRKALMLSCAVSAVAAGTIAPQRARADAFNGTMVNSPAATRINTGTGTETVSINPGASGKVTINWTPNEAGSGTINFLSNGNTATFQSVAGVTDYTVLNRVVPTDATRGISLNGTILSKLNDGSTGGRIWFYSPGGILVGSTARIDVGSLLLTTLDPVGFGSSADGFGQFQNQFDQASTISVDSLAEINANNAGSYIALIAPRVEQHGIVSVNGSAAYVAAEDVTMTINNGLFDIQVDLGTRDGNGVVHDGTTTGAANVDAGDNHSIYMVAVPKDTALTMLLSGNAGFAAATSASVENGQIVLSAGHNVFQGDFGVQFAQANSVDAGMNLGTGSYTSNVVGQATSDINVDATTGNTSFSGDLDLTSVSGAVRLTATNANQLTVGGAASLTSTKQFNPDLPQDPAIAVFAGSGGKVSVGDNLNLTARDEGLGRALSHGGNIYVTADGGDVTVAGAVTADATARDSFPSDEIIADAEGGQIIFRALNSGKLTTGGIVANASATGGYVNVQGDSAGNAQGGRVNVVSQSGGLVTVNGNFQGVADGTGGDVFGDGDAAGNGSAGAVYFSAQSGGDINVTGSVFLTGDGYGGDVIGPVTAFNVNGGIGRGSDYLQGSTTYVYGVGMETRDVNSAITVGGNVFMNANGLGGAGRVGGEAYGGDAGVRSFAGSIGIAGDLNFNARATGGNALDGFGGNGGLAIGGTTYVQAELSLGSSSAISGGNVTLDVGATGGTGGSGNGDNILAGAGGDGNGGTFNGSQDGSGGAFVLADNEGAVLSLGNVNLSALGTGGQGGAGGNGQAGGTGGVGTGGSVQAGTFRLPPFTSVAVAGQVSLGTVQMDSSGHGGNGGSGSGAESGVGGDGYGGGWCLGDGNCGGSLMAARGTVTFGDASILAQGYGGGGSLGGRGIGGDAEIYVPQNGSLTSVGNINISAAAFGGAGFTGTAAGGNATGGVAAVGVYDGGSVTGLLINLDSFARGGSGTTGGFGHGGQSIVELGNGSLSAGPLQLQAVGLGGDGSQAGGEGRGGTARIAFLAGGGTLTTTGASLIYAQGNGGAGTAGPSVGGAGGHGQGGTVAIDVAPELNLGASVTINTQDMDMRAAGTGGSGGSGPTGGAGGAGDGGTVRLALAEGDWIATGSVGTRTNGNGGFGGSGTGGAGGAGGAGTGGSTTINIGGALSALSFGSLNQGTGGNGGAGDVQGDGGFGQGGMVTATIDGAVTLTGLGNQSRLTVTSFGGGGNGGNGGDAQGGTSTLVVNGSLTTDENAQVTAQAIGGNGSSGVGGNGAAGNASLTINGNVNLGGFWVGANGTGGNGVTAGGNALGGSATVDLSGTGTIGSGLTEANATGGTASAGDGGDADGGFASVTAQNGSNITFASLNVTTNTAGGAGTTSGGDAQHVESSARIFVDTGAVLNSGSTTVTANGTGGNGDAVGGDGYGGTASLEVLSGGSITTGQLLVDATGSGGAANGQGGYGQGGASTIYLDGGSLTATSTSLDDINPTFQVSAFGNGGAGGIGGNAQGGDSAFLTGDNGGSMSVAGFGVFWANATGGAGLGAAVGNGGSGGDATGGTVTFNSPGNVSVASLRLAANGFAGDGGGAGVDGNGGDGGNATGGTVTADIYGDTTTGALVLRAFGQAGNGGVGINGGRGGDGTGGSSTLAVHSGTLSTAAIEHSTYGMAGDGGAGNSGVGGDGGTAVGGTNLLTVDSGATLNAASYFASARAPSGFDFDQDGNPVSAGGNGGIGATDDGAGGSSTSGNGTATIAGTANITGNFILTSFARGGDGITGGNASAGSSSITVDGVLNAGGILQSTASAVAGNGLTSGGDATGGTAVITVNGSASASTLFVATNAFGGAASDGAGGDALSGEALLNITNGGDLTGTNVTVGSDATGGAGTTSGGDAAVEVYARMQVDAGGSADVSGTTTISANATGGAATTGIGGQASGGQSSLIVDGTANTGATIMQASGIGGAGATSGNGDGGTATVTVSGALQAVSMTATANGSVGAGDILIDLLSGTMDLGIANLTANGGGVPGAGEDGIEIGSQGTLTASQLTMNSSDGIRISTANGGTINVSGTIDANSQALIRMLDDGAGGAISSNILDLDAADIQITALVQAADILMTLPGDYAINGLPVASNSLRITAGGNITAAANVSYANGLELIAGAGINILDLAAGGDLTLLAAGNIATGNLQATQDINLATPGAMTTGSIDAGGIFLALAHGDMSFGDVTASEVFLADFSMRTPSGGVTGNCIGTCGTLGADGVVIAPPSGSTYQYVTTDGGVTGEGQIAGVGGTDGSLYTTSAFTAAAGDDLSFWFNYVTSDGSDFTDYAWAQLLTGNLDPVAMLYTARTQPSGTIVPGQGLPGVEATLNPASVPINPDATTWSALGLDSGSCYDLGCGNTGWISSTYQIANAGTYVLRFGVTNFSDTAYESGMAFSGISVGGQTVTPGLTPTGGSITIGNVTTGNMTAAAGTTLTTGAIDATDFVDLHSGSNMQTGNITAGGYLQADAGGTMNLGVLSIGQDVNLDAVGNISFVSANVGTDFDFDTGGNIGGGNIVAGNHIGGSAAGTITLADLTVTGGLLPDENFSVGMSAGGDIVVGNVSASNPVGFATPGNLTTGNISAGGLFMTLVGGDIGVGSITTDTAGRVYLADYSMFAPAGGSDNFDATLVLALAPVATSGAITITGTVSTGMFQAAAGTTFSAADMLAGTSLAASAGGNLQVGNAQAGTSIDLSSGGSIVSTSLDAPFVSLTLAGDFTTGDLFVDNSLSITAGGNLTAGNILAGGGLALNAGLALIAQDLDAGGDLILSAGGNIDAGDLSAGGSMNFNSTAGAISTGSLSAAGGLFASAATGVNIADATVGLGVEIHTGGVLTIGSVDANTGVELDADGDVWASDIDSGSHVVVTAGGDFEVSDVTAGTTAEFSAGGLASFLGIVSAPEITVSSADIDIVDSASLGVLGVTDLITFNAVSAGQEVILGGDGTEAAAGQYQLAEDGDIESDTVVFNAVGASQGQPVNVRILDAEIEGSATQGGGVSSVRLNTAGSVFVRGMLSFTGAAATDTLAIHAGDSIQVVTDTGGIEMLGNDGNVAGTLDLTAHDIWVADQALLDQLNGASNLSDFEDALAINNGEVVPDGYLRAGGIDVTMLGSSLLVQNTGTDADPAGLTIGDGGLNIVNQGSEPATVIIFGHRQNADGTTTGGDAFLDEVQFSGPGGFDNSSTVNGCDVDGCGPSGETPGSIGGVESILGPIGLMSDPAALASSGADDFALPFDEGTDEASDEDDDEDSSDEDSSVDASVGLINTGPVSVEPPVEEPVTSGNDGPGF